MVAGPPPPPPPPPFTHTRSPSTVLHDRWRYYISGHSSCKCVYRSGSLIQLPQTSQSDVIMCVSAQVAPGRLGAKPAPRLFPPPPPAKKLRPTCTTKPSITPQQLQAVPHTPLPQHPVMVTAVRSEPSSIPKTPALAPSHPPKTKPDASKPSYTLQTPDPIEQRRPQPVSASRQLQKARAPAVPPAPGHKCYNIHSDAAHTPHTATATALTPAATAPARTATPTAPTPTATVTASAQPLNINLDCVSRPPTRLATPTAHVASTSQPVKNRTAAVQPVIDLRERTAAPPEIIEIAGGVQQQPQQQPPPSTPLFKQAQPAAPVRTKVTRYTHATCNILTFLKYCLCIYVIMLSD